MKENESLMALHAVIKMARPDMVQLPVFKLNRPIAELPSAAPGDLFAIVEGPDTPSEPVFLAMEPSAYSSQYWGLSSPAGAAIAEAVEPIGFFKFRLRVKICADNVITRSAVIKSKPDICVSCAGASIFLAGQCGACNGTGLVPTYYQE